MKIASEKLFFYLVILTLIGIYLGSQHAYKTVPTINQLPVENTYAETASVVESEVQEPLFSWSDVYTTMQLVETGGEPNAGVGAVGDDGNALGPYQIHYSYYLDAVEHAQNVVGRLPSSYRYEYCLDAVDFSQWIVQLYVMRYSPEQAAQLDRKQATLADLELVFRKHNGGPKGDQSPSTEQYWLKAQQLLNNQ
jgi:hypothetical protein